MTATRRQLPPTLPPAGPERVAALEALAGELVRVLGPVGAKYLVALVEELSAEQEARTLARARTTTMGPVS